MNVLGALDDPLPTPRAQRLLQTLHLADQTLDQTAHGRDPIAPDPAGQLARRLTVTRADTPLTQRDVYDPTETAHRWQRLATDIADPRKTDHERRTLKHELGKLAERRKALAAYYNRDRHMLDEVTSGLSRLTRTSRAERDRLHGALQRNLDCTEQIDQETLDLHDQLEQFGPRPDIETWEQEADRLRDVLDAAAAQTARRHEQRPPDWLVGALGSPPEQAEARALWRDAATRIQGFRTRWQIDDPDRALGDPLAASDVQRRDRQDLTWDLRETVREIHHIEPPDHRQGMVRQRSLGRGLSLQLKTTART